MNGFLQRPGFVIFMCRKYEEVYKDGVQEVSSLRKDHEMRVRELIAVHEIRTNSLAFSLSRAIRSALEIHHFGWWNHGF
jgi:hypothetical protein